MNEGIKPFIDGADGIGMGNQPNSHAQEREIQFLQNVEAFMRRDFDAIEGTMRSDVVMELPGSSWLAGKHQGYEGVGRCIFGLRNVLDADADQITFLHASGQMLVRLEVEVHGPSHDVDMTLRVRVRYDETGKWEMVSVEPDDLALFDHVLVTMPRDQTA
jgi:hypothetical protein